jgi:hypothetical protein
MNVPGGERIGSEFEKPNQPMRQQTCSPKDMYCPNDGWLFVRGGGGICLMRF